MARPIVLIGMMGSGKSFVGKVLSDKISLPFYDMDSIIEYEEGMSISEMFETHGEEYFRSLERSKLGELLEKGACVISTGGGVVLNKENMSAIKSKGISVWVDASVKTLLLRLQGDEQRPLLQSCDLSEKLEHLLNERKELYSCADIRVSNDGMDILEVVEKIVSYIGSKNS